MRDAYTYTYTYTYADCLATLRARSVGRRTGLRRIGRYVLLNLIFLAAAAAVALLDGGSLPDLRDPAVALLFAKVMAGLTAFMALVDVVFERWMPWFAFRRLAVRNQPVRLQFGDTVAWSMNGMSGEASWSSVKRFLATPSGLFLFVSEAEAFMLPRRALADDAEFKSLAAFARERIAAAGPDAPAPAASGASPGRDG